MYNEELNFLGEEEEYNPEFEKINSKQEIAKEMLQAVLEQLYSKDKLDANQLEWHLDELCFALDIKLNAGDLNISRKNN